jgi:hypothetical protein
MVSKGAKTLMLLSRSGAVQPAAQTLVDDLRSKDVTVKIPHCDVSSWESLLAALQVDSLPPIKGCINASMVLNVSVVFNPRDAGKACR